MQRRRHIERRLHDLGRRIAALFIVGSSLFALGSFPPYAHFVDGRVVGINIAIVNSGTFLGAVCVLVGASLLLPARRPLRSA